MAFKSREQILRNALSGPSTLLPSSFRAVVKKCMQEARKYEASRKQIAAEESSVPSAAPPLELYFKEARRDAFVKTAAPGDVVLVRVIKSTVRVAVGSFDVKILGWYAQGRPVILWDLAFTGSIATKEAQSKVLSKAYVNVVLRCEILHTDRLKSLQFVELTTLARKSTISLGLIQDNESAYGKAREVFCLDKEGEEVPKYNVALERSEMLESLEVLEKIRTRLLIPSFACNFVSGDVRPLPLAELREEQDRFTSNKLYQQGLEILAKRRFDKAKELFKEALKRYERNADCYVGLGIVCVSFFFV
jgi:tetratricopeptide (TPR) repeat protein